MFYVMQVNLDNGWTCFKCSDGGWAHRLKGNVLSVVESYPEPEAKRIIEEAIEKDKQLYPACWERYKYVLVEL